MRTDMEPPADPLKSDLPNKRAGRPFIASWQFIAGFVSALAGLLAGFVLMSLLSS